MSWLFTSGGQKIGASASSSVLSMNIQDWFPLGLTGLISLQSKELLRVFSSTTVWKHQLFGTQPSLWSTWVHMEATSVWLGFLTSWQPRKSHSFQLVTEMQKHCPGKQNRATSHFVTQLQKSYSVTYTIPSCLKWSQVCQEEGHRLHLLTSSPSSPKNQKNFEPGCCCIVQDVFSELSYSSQACYQLSVERIVSWMFLCWPVSILLYLCLPLTMWILSCSTIYQEVFTRCKTLTPQKRAPSVSLFTRGLLNLSTAPPPWWMCQLQFTTWSLLILRKFLSGLLTGMKYFSEHWENHRDTTEELLNKFTVVSSQGHLIENNWTGKINSRLNWVVIFRNGKKCFSFHHQSP